MLIGGACLCGVDGRRASECAEVVRGCVQRNAQSVARFVPSLPLSHPVRRLARTLQRCYATDDMVTSAETVRATSSLANAENAAEVVRGWIQALNRTSVCASTYQ